MLESPDEARLHRLRGRVNAITTLLAIVLLLLVRSAALDSQVGVELDSPAFAVTAWLFVGYVLAVPLVYAAALLLGVRPASPADVVRGVLTVLLAWLPLVWAWAPVVLTLWVLFALWRLGLRIAASRRAAVAAATPARD